jgi:cytoskeletal protein CcmA (bactofilin family)
MATPHTATVIGPDTHIKGEMVFDTDAHILGTFEGRITSRGQIHVGEGATCRAILEGATVVVDGTVEGNITGAKRVLLNATARVTGDITAPSMAVAEGAWIAGLCTIRAGEATAATAPAGVLRPELRLNGTERVAR